eukprot:2237669-Pleurochrysis_carterae.AAC.1
MVAIWQSTTNTTIANVPRKLECSQTFFIVFQFVKFDIINDDMLLLKPHNGERPRFLLLVLRARSTVLKDNKNTYTDILYDRASSKNNLDTEGGFFACSGRD